MRRVVVSLSSRIVLPLLSLLVYGMALVFVSLRLAIPSDGTRLALISHPNYPNSVQISPVSASDSPLRPDEHLIAVDGQPISQWTVGLRVPEGMHPNWTLGQTVSYTIDRDGVLIDIPVELRPFPLWDVLWHNAAIVIFVLLLQLEALAIWWPRRRDIAAQVLLLAVSAFTAFCVAWYVGTDVPTLINAPALIVAYRVITSTILMLMCTTILHFVLLLPRRDRLVPLARHTVYAIYATPALVFPLVLALLYTPNTQEWLRRWEIGSILLVLAGLIASALAIVYGYAQLRQPASRLHVRIIAIAFTLAVIIAVSLAGIPLITTGRFVIYWNVLPLLSLPVTLGLAVAVVFYGLFDFRIVIQRTLVYGTLTALIVVIYVLVVGVFGALFQMQASPVFSLIATGIVAVMFADVRSRLQRAVNTLLYGQRDKPLDLINRLSDKIEATREPEEALAQIVQTVAQALKLPYVAIDLLDDGQYVPSASYGTAGQEIIFPLHCAGKLVGRMVVSPRSSGEVLTSGDIEILSGLLYHAESTVQAGQLMADLQHSRERLVLTREEERRRLRRDLHDGLGPALASLTLQVDAARNRLDHDREKVEPLLIEIKAQIADALADIRRVVYELRPPALDQMGLLGTIEERARELERGSGLSIQLDLPAALPPLSAASEVAIYRICMEALTNVIRHADASRCAVHLSCNGCLRLEVNDNGRGLADQAQRGVGMSSMIERASELGGTCVIETLPGGGTRVLAELPLTAMIQPE